MRFRVPIRGVHIGPTCVDGSSYEPGTVAHAHTTGHPPVGYICAVSMTELRECFIHEAAHLAADAGHDDHWRKSVHQLGGRVPAAYQKRPRG